VNALDDVGSGDVENFVASLEALEVICSIVPIAPSAMMTRSLSSFMSCSERAGIESVDVSFMTI